MSMLVKKGRWGWSCRELYIMWRAYSVKAAWNSVRESIMSIKVAVELHEGEKETKKILEIL